MPTLTDTRSRIAYLVASLALASLPFAVVDFVPATDLPQHAAQVRLLAELWGLAPATVDLSQAVARPFGAHALVYWPMFVLARVVSPHAAANLTLWLIVLLSACGLHAIAWRRARSPVHAQLATMLLFNIALYWGFLNFLCGLPLFLLLAHHMLRTWAPAHRVRTAALTSVALLALPWAHAFWLPCAALAAAIGVAARRDLKDALTRAACFVPASAALLAWVPSLTHARRAGGFKTAAAYLTGATDRLSWTWLVDNTLGGIARGIESAFVAVVLLWLAFAWFAAPAPRRTSVDAPLLGLGAVLLAFGYAAPDQYVATIYLNSRFLAVALMLLLLASPAPRGRLSPWLAGLVVALFSFATAVSWSVYDQDDVAGLRESIAAVREPKKVLGLSFRKTAATLRHEPFLQSFAYVQAAHGGEVAFSFAQHQSSVVAYTRPRPVTWTAGLDWFPERVKARDVAQFDCVLVNAEPAVHPQFAAAFQLTSAVEAGYFRLYCRDP